jgi:hypothetical protein
MQVDTTFPTTLVHNYVDVVGTTHVDDPDIIRVILEVGRKLAPLTEIIQVLPTNRMSFESYNLDRTGSVTRHQHRVDTILLEYCNGPGELTDSGINAIADELLSDVLSMLYRGPIEQSTHPLSPQSLFDQISRVRRNSNGCDCFILTTPTNHARLIKSIETLIHRDLLEDPISDELLYRAGAIGGYPVYLTKSIPTNMVIVGIDPSPPTNSVVAAYSPYVLLHSFTGVDEFGKPQTRYRTSRHLGLDAIPEQSYLAVNY